MDNVTILANPGDENIDISTRGVTVDAKAAKLNNKVKRPVLVENWQEKITKIDMQPSVSINPQKYVDLIRKLDITTYFLTKETSREGAKKLRVNKIVNTKTSNVWKNSPRIEVPVVQQEVKLEPQSLQNVESTLIDTQKPVIEARVTPVMESSVQNSRLDIHGRHERTGEIPVNNIREAVRNDNPRIESPVSNISRMERNTSSMDMPLKDEIKQEPSAVDMDLYTNLMKNNGQDDVSRQLQGARRELSKEKEASKKLAEQYSEAVKELKILKDELETKKKERIQRDKKELSETLNNIETLKRENLDRTSDLSSIRAEIERLKAENDALGNDFYDSYHSYGRAA